MECAVKSKARSTTAVVPRTTVCPNDPSGMVEAISSRRPLNALRTDERELCDLSRRLDESGEPTPSKLESTRCSDHAWLDARVGSDATWSSASATAVVLPSVLSIPLSVPSLDPSLGPLSVGPLPVGPSAGGEVVSVASFPVSPSSSAPASSPKGMISSTSSCLAFAIAMAMVTVAPSPRSALLAGLRAV